MSKRDVNFDIKINGKQIDLTKTSFNQLKKVIGEAKKSLNELPLNDPRYKVLNSEIKNADKAWKELTKTTEDFSQTLKESEEPVKSYKAQIMDLQKEQVKLAEAGQKNSKVYQENELRIKELRDKQEEFIRSTQQLDDSLAALPGPIGRIGSSMQSLEVVTQSTRSAVSSLTQTFPILKNAIAASGIGALIIIFATLVAGIIDAAKKSESLQMAFAAIGDAVGAVFDAIKPLADFLIGIFVGAIEIAAKTLEGFASLFGGVNRQFKQESLLLEKQLKIQETILNEYNSILSESLQKRLQIENDYTKRNKEIIDENYKNEEDRNRDLLVNRLNYLNKMKNLDLEEQQSRHKNYNELYRINFEAFNETFDNQRKQEKNLRALQQSEDKANLNMLKNQNNLRIDEIKSNMEIIKKMDVSNKDELLDVAQKALNEEMLLKIFYRDKEKAIDRKTREENKSAQRQYNREDIAAIKERNIKTIELTTSLIREENARNLQAAKDKLISLKEEQRLELEQAKLQGITLIGIKKKQAAETRVVEEEIRKAQIQMDVYNIQLRINQQERLLAELNTKDVEYYEKRRDIVKEQLRIDIKLADGNADLIAQARTKQYQTLIQIDKEEMNNVISNMELQYQGLLDVSDEAFNMLREIEKKRFEEQQKGNEQNYAFIEALNKDHHKKMEMIDASQLRTYQDYLERRAQTELKFYGKRFKDLEDAENLRYAAEVKAALNNAEQLELIEREHVQRLKDLQNEKIMAYAAVATAVFDSFSNVTNALASFYEFEASNTKRTAEQRKKSFEQMKNYQIATALLSAASGVIQILTQPSILPSPFDWIVKIANAAALGIMTAVQIKRIKSTEFRDTGGASGGRVTNNLGRNYEKGGLIGGKRHAEGGTIIEAEKGEAIMTRGAVTMFQPMLSMMNQLGGGTPFNNGIMGGASPDNPALNNSNTNNFTPIIKTYVVSSEMTSEMEKQARLKDLSTL